MAHPSQPPLPGHRCTPRSASENQPGAPGPSTPFRRPGVLAAGAEGSCRRVSQLLCPHAQSRMHPCTRVHARTQLVLTGSPPQSLSKQSYSGSRRGQASLALQRPSTCSRTPGGKGAGAGTGAPGQASRNRLTLGGVGEAGRPSSAHSRTYWSRRRRQGPSGGSESAVDRWLGGRSWTFQSLRAGAARAREEKERSRGPRPGPGAELGGVPGRGPPGLARGRGGARRGGGAGREGGSAAEGPGAPGGLRALRAPRGRGR